jgi:rhamnosyltransferase
VGTSRGENQAEGSETQKEMKPSVSIVVPTRNGGPEFRQLLERVTKQKGSYDPEIVVVDSGSSDGTSEVARHFGATVIDVPPGTFNHGLTRNLGIQHSKGEICVLLVQDALPVSDRWLEALVHPFDHDPLICGVTTRQVPRPGTDIVANWEVVQHNKLLGESVKIRSIPDWSTFERLSLQDRFLVCNFDNVCSAIRRSTWKTHPFRSLLFAEDLDWAVRILRAGNKIAYEPAAVVLHSHVRPAIYHLRRYYISAKVVPEILQCSIPGTFSCSDDEFFAAVNYMIQEVFSFWLLIDQLGGYISQETWLEWVRLADRASIAQPMAGARNVTPFESICRDALQGWPRRKLAKPTRSDINPAPMRDNPMRSHFSFLLSEVVHGIPELNADGLRHLLVHCLARSVGHFLGGHYLWSSRRGQVSPALRALDSVLCVGV